ncbi:uncharacterized protein V6R79_005844 [Siganus canaliculatus]
MNPSDFNGVLLAISKELSSTQLEDLKFLCRDFIGKKDQEKIDDALKLFRFLSERRKLGEDNREFLSGLLNHINRPDLSQRLDNFQSPVEPARNEEEARLNIATQVVAENLGKQWRKLGRKLGLSEVKLESISTRHPTDLEETTVELLKEWRKFRGLEARPEELISALRACHFNLTADKVVKALQGQ